MDSVRFDHVSKRFILRHARARSVEDLLLTALRRRANGSREEFWALRDVDLAIAPGEAVGLIGPNGAGKSTLLKLIARIIEPTSGRIVVQGRVGALLEVVAGFHEDLSGRENVFLSGSLMGLSRREIQARFDDIVAFAEMEKFIDSPVKHYSTGMYMRLGFAVAATLEPEVLLIDESLAVGDAAFQRKCLIRIAEVKQRGATILFVSHQAQQVEQLCSRAILLWEGQVRADGAPAQVQRVYGEMRQKRLLERIHAEHLDDAERYAAEYRGVRVPAQIPAGASLKVPITLRNTSPFPWRPQSAQADHTIVLSYHWMDRWGTVVVWDGERTALPREVAPGAEIAIQAEVCAPDLPDLYHLEFDLLDDGVAWFSQRAVPSSSHEVQVVPPDNGNGHVTPSALHEPKVN